MIRNDQELHIMLERIAYFQRQVSHLREGETNPENYRFSVSGYMAELDRMNLEVRDYLWLLPSECEPLASQQNRSANIGIPPLAKVL